MSDNKNEEVATLKAQMNQLEIKISFQEYTIEELNYAVSKQQEDINKLTTQLRFLLDKLKAMEPSNIASNSEETPPPHY